MHRPRNVLVVYSLLMHPLRATTSDHLYCFRRYGNDRYFYVNVGARRIPGWLRRIDFDAVLFHHTLIAYRFESDRFVERGICCQGRSVTDHHLQAAPAEHGRAP